jgi:predicted nucleotidyltransferase
VKKVFSTDLFEEIEKERMEQRESLRIELLEKTRLVLLQVFKNLKVKSVYITGSLAVPNKFFSYSDIDIAAEGISSENYFSVLAKLNELLPRTVELIELESCKFASRIKEKGIRVI